MGPSTWQKTGCVLCAQNCGLELQIEDDRIARVRPDKDNPRSRGYACRKGMQIAHYQHHGERLTTPLKKVATGFVPIPWEQAYAEIGERLASIVATHGPRSFAYLGGGGQGCHFEAAFGLTEGNEDVELTNRSSSIKTLEWERIHEVLAETGFNISEAARRLGMHRRTLTRKLEKRRV